MKAAEDEFSQEMMAKIREAAREPDLVIALSRNLFGGDPLIYLRKPGATPRSKPVDLLDHVLVGNKDTMKHSAMLRTLATILEEEGR